MLVFDYKDFREDPDIEIAVTEQAVADALVEAGVSLTEAPLSIRVRVKYIRPDRFMLSRFDTIDDAKTEFRLNIYVPPFATALSSKWYDVVNKSIRHDFAHVAQTRKHQPGFVPDQETLVEYENEAQAFAETGQKCVVIKP